MRSTAPIVPLSFSFAAGVAVVEFAALPHSLLQAAFPACAILLAGLMLRPSDKGAFALFFALGLSCAALSSLPGAGFSSPGFIRTSLSATEKLIVSVPFPHGQTAALLRALLTGQRDMLARETAAVFRDAGASHILALSGMHLGIIYLMLGKALSLMGRSRVACAIRSILLIGACCFYAFMTGASPSIVRALLFIVFNEWLKHSPGRTRRPVAIWSASLMIQLGFSPESILSAGFQLSYLAMLGIFTVYPRLEAFYPEGRGPVRWMWKTMALSLSCQLFTAPLAWIRFGTFPKYFLLANLMAMPLTWALMLCGAATLLLSAAGICPSLLVKTTDSLALVLQGCLEIISSM
ncbi:MAG: ComEC/Rec2 family competence protein [Bacteroidales bacterium]|nr:ComEC/Rec2 family competence protein [Bacteroidales bacterium]